MQSRRGIMASINVLGGTAVLGSYAYCLLNHPEKAGDFWGSVPEGLRSLCTASMFLAAAGYLAFTFFLMFRLQPTGRDDERFGVGAFNAFYTLVLVPSALWMPLTLVMLESPSAGLWWLIRLVLAAVGIGSLGILAGLVAVRPRAFSPAHALAIGGSLAFCFQTAFLDAVVWPAFFPV
jgi:hypothetical protein